MKSAVFAFIALAVSLVRAQNITCETQQHACDEQLGANHACCAALYAGCAAGSTKPDSAFNQCSNGPPCPTCTATVAAATASTVSSACAAQFALCKTQVGEKDSCCAALQASCLAGTVSPESDVSQCSNGPPCSTCTVSGSGSTTPSSTTTSAATSYASSIVPPCPTCTVSGAAYGSGSMPGYSSLTTSPVSSLTTSPVSSPTTSPVSSPTTSPVASTTSGTAFTGAADAHRGAGGILAFGLVVAVMF